MRYDVLTKLWWCGGYKANTPLEAWGMWEQQRRIREVTLSSNQKLLEELYTPDKINKVFNIPSWDDVVAIRSLDRAIPNQPDYTNVNPPKDSWSSVGIPNLVKKIKNWRGGKSG
jgi:hypothetical protein